MEQKMSLICSCDHFFWAITTSLSNCTDIFLFNPCTIPYGFSTPWILYKPVSICVGFPYLSLQIGFSAGVGAGHKKLPCGTPMSITICLFRSFQKIQARVRLRIHPSLCRICWIWLWDDIIASYVRKKTACNLMSYGWTEGTILKIKQML